MRTCGFVCLVAFVFAWAAVPAAADADALWQALRQGGHVALIRHADAPGGAGDPAGFRLDDCATQRNLSEAGRRQARALGARLREREVTPARLLTSQWCRCRETAELLGLGPAEDSPAFNNAYVLADRREDLRRAGRAVVAGWSGPGTLVVVTHGANILALTGIHPAQAAIVVVAPDPDSDRGLRLLGQIAASE